MKTTSTFDNLLENLTALAQSMRETEQHAIDQYTPVVESIIRLNTELVKKPKELLEYVIVHEMAHLLEPTHSERFVALLDQHFPTWREAPPNSTSCRSRRRTGGSDECEAEG